MFYGCVPGWFHDTCNETCSNTCLNRSCNQVSGYCDIGCIAGWYGGNCEKTCNDKCIKASCDQLTGACSNGCIPGWYGYKCDNICTNTCHNRSCNQLSGNCSNGCLYGWYGDTCEKSCSHTCINRSCDQVLGHCNFGCADGFQGDMCDERCKEFSNVSMTEKRNLVLNSGIDPVVYAVGGCLFGVIASLSCAVIIVYVRKAIIRRRWYDNFDTSARESSTQIYDEIVQSSGSTLGSISNTYTDIRSELTIENIEESTTSSRFSRYYELQDIGTSKSIQRHHLEIDDKAAVIHTDKHAVGTSSGVNTESLDGRGVAHSWPTTLTKQQETKHLSYKCDVSGSSVNRSRNITHLDNGVRDSCINYRDIKCNSFEQVQLQMGRNEGEDSGSVYYLHPIS